MGVFDWLGPLNVGATRRGWDALPALPDEAKSIPLSTSNVAFTTNTLVYGVNGLSDTFASPDTVQMNSAVFACLDSIATAVSEPELTVYRDEAGNRVEIDAGELSALLASPNPSFSMDTLLAYLAVSLHIDGNAYWRKLRAGDPLRGNVVELWPISPASIEPITESGSSAFISYYRYWQGAGDYLDLPVSSIVHFRYGLDDRDHRKGLAPLKRLVRETSSDIQATRYADRLLANLAINGLSLTFDKDAPAIDQKTADEMKAKIKAAYGGDNVGDVAVIAPGGTLTALGFSPEQMDLKTLHRVPEERITAVLGVPAIVAGLGAGLDHATYANYREAREAFTEQKLLPFWASLAATITLQLVPDFTSDKRVVVAFDTDDVRALADDQNALALRLKTLVEAGIIDADEARAEIGYAARPASPASLTVLPTAASRRVERRAPDVERKALPDDYARLRAESLPDWEHELLTYFEQQQRRILRRLHAGADTGYELVTEGEAILLGETLTPLQLHQLAAVERLVIAELGVTFRLDDPATRRYLAQAGQHVVAITESTRRDVQGALSEGQQAGEGIPALAKRLRDLPAFNQARANVVARTELGTSQNAAALASYRGSGVVVGVRVHDGDFDAACAAMNGRTFSLDQAPPELQHPNCVRAFAPLTEADELTRSA